MGDSIVLEFSPFVEWMNGNWLHIARLRRQAGEGNEKAKEILSHIDKGEMVESLWAGTD